MNEIKQEASLPVQTRLDVRTLVNLAEYWETKGIRIKTMSQLVSWSIELVQHLLSTNGMLPSVTESVAEANAYLMKNRLWQPGLRKKGHAKLINAMTFESLRNEGIDPGTYVKHQHSMVHNPHSVQTPEFSEPVAVSPGLISDDQWEKVQKRIKEDKEREETNRVPDTSPIVPQISTGGLNEEVYKRLKGEPTTVDKKGSSKLKPKSKEELETMEGEFEREERKELERLKGM